MLNGWAWFLVVWIGHSNCIPNLAVGLWVEVCLIATHSLVFRLRCELVGSQTRDVMVWTRQQALWVTSTLVCLNRLDGILVLINIGIIRTALDHCHIKLHALLLLDSGFNRVSIVVCRLTNDNLVSIRHNDLWVFRWLDHVIKLRIFLPIVLHHGLLSFLCRLVLLLTWCLELIAAWSERVASIRRTGVVASGEDGPDRLLLLETRLVEALRCHVEVLDFKLLYALA